MTDILPYWSTHPVPQFPISFDGVFYAGSVKPLHKSSQCQQALRMARATAIEILKTNLDGMSPRVAISFRASRPVSGSQTLTSWQVSGSFQPGRIAAENPWGKPWVSSNQYIWVCTSIYCLLYHLVPPCTVFCTFFYHLLPACIFSCSCLYLLVPP